MLHMMAQRLVHTTAGQDKFGYLTEMQPCCQLLFTQQLTVAAPRAVTSLQKLKNDPVTKNGPYFICAKYSSRFWAANTSFARYCV